MAEGSEIASEIVAMKTLTFLTGLKMFILPSLQSVFLLFAIGSVNSQSGMNVEQTDLEDLITYTAESNNTGRMGWMAYRKWKKIKLQPGTAGPGNMLSCCLVSFPFLCVTSYVAAL